MKKLKAFLTEKREVPAWSLLLDAALGISWIVYIIVR